MAQNKSKVEINFPATFSVHRDGVSKAGKDYNFIELSNGLKTEIFGTDLTTDATSQFEEFDEVIVTYVVDPFNRYNNKITKLSPAKSA